MKIVVLTSSLSLGGTERVVASLCNSWVARGDEVTLIVTYSGGGKPFYPISPVAELIYLADVVGVRKTGVPACVNYVKRLLALRQLIKEREPDVILSFLPNVNIAAILSSAFLPVPVIICERSDPSGHHGFHLLKALRHVTYRFADMLVVQTAGAADQARRLYPGLKSVSFIPNALPPDLPACVSAAPDDRKILLSLGRLAPEKQVDRLIDAFAVLAPRYGDWDLHIYGDGPELPALTRQVAQAGLRERVFLHGATSAPWGVMAGADAFAMVSRNEGFPNALLEAMGIGLPCVVFDCPSGPRDITRSGKDALLVEMNNREALLAALKKLMGDEELRLALGRRGRESVFARYGHPRVMKMWDQLFIRVGVGCTTDTPSIAGQG